MESADLTPHPKPEDDNVLDQLLRQRSAPLPDDGFSRRVMAALPKRRKSSRNVFVAVGALAGIAVAITRIESLAALQNDWTAVKLTLAQSTSVLSDPGFLVVISVAGVSLVYAFAAATLNRS